MLRSCACRLLTCLAIVAMALPALAQPETVCSGRIPVAAGSASFQVPYCANVDLDGGSLEGRRAIVVVHGSDRNADQYLAWVRDAAILAGAPASTILVAPQFLTAADLDAFLPGEDTLYWTEDGWKQGELSGDTAEHPRSGKISSFAVLEEFLLRIARAAPDLETIVVVGHSAGAQFVQRFAAGNGIDAILDPVEVRYVVANPGSYMYFSPERLVPGTASSFEVPADTGCDSWYDDYKYGLQDLNEYLAAAGAASISSRYPVRNVRYLLGEDDDDPNDPWLNTGCPSSLQGPHRLARGVIFYRHIVDHFGPAIATTHQGAIVPAVGHSARRMFQSDCGLYHLFDATQYAGACGSLADAVVPTATPESARARGIAFEGASPNPFNPRTTLRFRTTGPGPVTVRIFSADGRRAHEFRAMADPDGTTTVTWDGRDARGAAVASGVYRIEARQGGAVATGSVVLLR